VEVHIATRASAYLKSGGDYVTWMSSAEADNGWFAIGSNNDLYYVKSRNTGAGTIEVHSATASSGYAAVGVQHGTRFSLADAANGWFTVSGADLYFIKTLHTGSGAIEVHTATSASQYASGQDVVTRFGGGDAANGWFTVSGADLYYIKTIHTGSGRMEVHTAFGATATPYASGQDFTTWFNPGDAGNGWFSIAVGGDLNFIKTKHTAGQVEVHVATKATSYLQSGGDWPTWFSSAE